MKNNNKYAYVITEKGWTNGSGYSYETTFDSRELDADDYGDSTLVEKVKNGTFGAVDWDDFIGLSEKSREELVGDTNAEETDTQWVIEIFNIDDYRNGDILDPVYKCSAWKSDLAKEWIAGIEE